MSVGLFSLCFKFCISEISQDFIFSLILPAIITLGNPKVTISFTWHSNIYLKLLPLSKAPVLDFQLPTSRQTWQAKNHWLYYFHSSLKSDSSTEFTFFCFILFCFFFKICISPAHRIVPGLRKGTIYWMNQWMSEWMNERIVSRFVKGSWTWNLLQLQSPP